MNSKWIGGAAFLAVMTVFAACNNDDDNNNNPTPTNNVVNLKADINGLQEKPTSTTSTATGTMTGTIDTTTNVMSYTVTYQGITPTAGHIHRIDSANGTGAPIIPFASLTSPISGTTSLRRTQRDSILAGQYYVNFHTAAYPNGEIRGDIKKQ
ncbi:CHRD domain-containing protein [Arsenicibacter rosenii]|uniref:CHRD domain-containing protein n=1 Tax=Arsenicibacter rosenii TaxID=1750698 RepID=A0A1S2VRR4_9BACT|nr:CHRD domain-containing protein [Arsenicibacter rosenii]OIN61005.1 CHRD domain-containing protein [Arsenicibacter rosenii]